MRGSFYWRRVIAENRSARFQSADCRQQRKPGRADVGADAAFDAGIKPGTECGSGILLLGCIQKRCRVDARGARLQAPATVNARIGVGIQMPGRGVDDQFTIAQACVWRDPKIAQKITGAKHRIWIADLQKFADLPPMGSASAR